jgi:hypothetical protein
VLFAAGIESDFIRGSGGWNLRVGFEDRGRALKAIASYLSENEVHHHQIVCFLIASGMLIVCWWAGAGGR